MLCQMTHTWVIDGDIRKIVVLNKNEAIEMDGNQHTCHVLNTYELIMSTYFDIFLNFYFFMKTYIVH